jgi:hypothetical protein
MENKEFNNDNFCVLIEELKDITKLENIIKAIRPADYEFVLGEDWSIYSEPYFGVQDGELYVHSLPWAEEWGLSELAVNIIKWKLEGVINNAKVKNIEIWQPTIGEHVYASMLGTKYKEVVFMYAVRGTYYCIDQNDFNVTELDSGQKIIKLTAFRHLKPLFQ